MTFDPTFTVEWSWSRGLWQKETDLDRLGRIACLPRQCRAQRHRWDHRSNGGARPPSRRPTKYRTRRASRVFLTAQRLIARLRHLQFFYRGGSTPVCSTDCLGMRMAKRSTDFSTMSRKRKAPLTGRLGVRRLQSVGPLPWSARPGRPLVSSRCRVPARARTRTDPPGLVRACGTLSRGGHRFYERESAIPRHRPTAYRSDWPELNLIGDRPGATSRSARAVRGSDGHGNATETSRSDGRTDCNVDAGWHRRRSAGARGRLGGVEP